MKHSPSADAARAALYALGALPHDQQVAFEERLRAQPALHAEAAALCAVAAELALAAEPVPPRAAVRERVLANLGAPAATPSAPAPPDLLFALRADDVWLPVCPGIERRELATTAGGASYLLRVAPGATIPDHAHRRVEHSFVLRGSIAVEGTLCRAGDYHRAAPGTVHTAPHSVGGCVMLVIEGAA